MTTASSGFDGASRSSREASSSCSSTRALESFRFGQQTVAEVAAHDRVTHWRRIEPYVRGKVRRVVGEPTEDHFDCQIAEFRDAQRRVTVAVYEFC